MSASLKVEPFGRGFIWTQAEMGRAKELRREGYTGATIAGILRQEFGTARTRSGIETMFRNLKRRGETLPARTDPARKRATLSEVAAANTIRRECLANGRGHWFDSEGPGNRICPKCKSLGTWW